MQIARIENIIYKIILKLSESVLKEILSSFKKKIKGLKKFQGIIIK